MKGVGHAKFLMVSGNQTKGKTRKHGSRMRPKLKGDSLCGTQDNPVEQGGDPFLLDD